MGSYRKGITMANEKKALKNALIKLLIICIFSILYCLGGMQFKFLRRFIAPAVLCGGMFYFSRDWRSLAQMPLMMFSLSLGYGADTILEKVIKRLIFGLANGLAFSVYNILNKRWLLVTFQVTLTIAAFIFFGAFTPFETARTEELILGLFIAAIPMFSVKEV